MEIRKDIKWYEWLYEVSNYGNIKSIDRYVSILRYWKVHKAHIKWCNISANQNKFWYLYVKLCRRWKYEHLKVHRAVWMSFLENKDNKSCINHKDWNKQNNVVDNLEWCTRSYNTQHSINILWNQLWPLWRTSKLCHTSKKTIQYNIDWSFVQEWDCMMDIKRKLWRHCQSISEVCRWIRKTAYWFIRKFSG